MFEFLFKVTLTVLLATTPLLIHEMGHWAVLRRYHVRVNEYWLGLGPMLFRHGRLRVGMFPIGGAIVPEPERYAQLTGLQRMWVALAGPLASVSYGLVMLTVWALTPGIPGSKGLWTIAMLNFMLAGVNALPVPPLDGFQALSNWLNHRGRPLSERTLARAYRLGNGLVYGVGFCVLGFSFFKH